MKTIAAIVVLTAALHGACADATPSSHFSPPGVVDTNTSRNAACTSFCLVNSGYALFGTNYDHGANIDDGLIFLNKRNVAKSYWEEQAASPHARWISKYASVTFNLVMSQFAWAGMNEAGLTISTMELTAGQSPAPDDRPWIYSNMWVQYLLDNCATADEVIASDSQVRIRDYVDHYLVCDRTGACATIEFLDGRMVHHTGKTLPVKALANNTYVESIAVWKSHRTPPAQGNRAAIKDPSLLRFMIAADRAAQFEATDSRSANDYAFDTLEAVSGQRVNGSPTHWSIVFDTEILRISFRTATNSDIRYINMRDLDFSCDTPVRMLDIHEKLVGDVTDKMRVYSTELHLEHALRASGKWESRRTPASLRKEIEYIEDYPCN